SLHPTPYTLHPTPYTLLPTPYSLLPTPYSLENAIDLTANWYNFLKIATLKTVQAL
ncbi:MAG: hypothetical protein F6J99_30955, partial [Moorea sp. SIO4G3]|nr:hypothetical protein [Moorena sp. SIO4G3]